MADVDVDVKVATMSKEEFQEVQELFNRQHRKRHGWHADYKAWDKDSPAGRSMTTVGLTESFGHPEVQVAIYADEENLHNLLHVVADRVAKGTTFRHGDRVNDLFSAKDHPVLFRRIKGVAVETLRMIIPGPDKVTEREKMCAVVAVQFHGCED